MISDEPAQKLKYLILNDREKHEYEQSRTSY